MIAVSSVLIIFYYIPLFIFKTNGLLRKKFTLILKCTYTKQRFREYKLNVTRKILYEMYRWLFLNSFLNWQI